jgi:hypothetical protein
MVVGPNLNNWMLLQVLPRFPLCSLRVGCGQIVPSQRCAAEVDRISDKLALGWGTFLLTDSILSHLTY